MGNARRGRARAGQAAIVTHAVMHCDPATCPAGHTRPRLHRYARTDVRIKELLFTREAQP